MTNVAVAVEPMVLRQDKAGITHLTMNRPRQYNALSEEMLDALAGELTAVAADPAVRVVILSGAGKAFCPGHDLKQMRAQYRQDYYDSLFERCSRLMLQLVKLPQPVIARVQGIATAAGCQLVATADLAVASSDARFAVSGINVGLFCATPGVALSRNVPRKRALEMLLTGDFIDAQTAASWGLINRVARPEDLDATVLELARKIAAKPPAAVRAGKQLFYRQLETGLSQAYIDASATMACNMMTPDAAEGIDAFIEKRPPAWNKP